MNSNNMQNMPTDNNQQMYNNQQIDKQTSNSMVIYSITHTIILFFAVYLSFRCNPEFNLLSLIFALCCPQCYILFALASKGGCGLFDNKQ